MALFSSLNSTPLSRQELLSMRLFYMSKLIGFNSPFYRVGWKSRKTQEARFNALLAIDDLKGKSILDLGCGLGCLYGYLKEKGWKGEYTGMDVLDMMVKGASDRFPGVVFEKRNILIDLPRRQWDYVFISGIFNHKVKDNWSWIEKTVRTCFNLSRLGMAFNLLESHSREDDLDSVFFYAKRTNLEQKASLWSGGNYKMIYGYLPDDMTAYLYHSKGLSHE
jgi:SAM-dependent methyltransferase